MNILIAPNALKGSLTAGEALIAIKNGINRASKDCNTLTLAIADGGDGLLEALQPVLSAEEIIRTVINPLGEPVNARFLYDTKKKLAVIETAEACGLRLLTAAQYAPLLATSFGLGELILAALDLGAERLILGIGGSATNDAGMGMSIALGVKFLDADSCELTGNAESLVKIVKIECEGLDPRLKKLHWQVACDVDNPLLGELGAAQIYGPQKGASAAQVAQIENGLEHWADCIESLNHIRIRDVPGTGAAGGLGACLKALFAAELRPGAELVLDMLGLDELLAQSDLVITTEGKLDEQTLFGKAPAIIARKAAEKNVPCIVIAGQISDKMSGLYRYGINSAYSLCSGPMELEYAMKNAAVLLEQSAEQLLRLTIKFYATRNEKRKGIMIKKCLFPAAGYGTRFLPATKAMPKEILPVMEKPLIQYGVEEAMEAGMREIAIITGRGKRALEDHFDTSFELEQQISGTSKESLLAGIRDIIDKCTFSYTRQIAMRGLGDAILCGQTLIGNEPFGVILADDLCEGEGQSVMRQMAEIYEKYRCSVIAIQEVEPEEVYKYGIIEGRELDDGVFLISNMVEKPDPEDAPSNLAIIGRYILTPDIFEVLKHTPNGKNGELQLTDALQTQAAENMVIGYKFKGKRFDCGSIDGYVEATNYFYNKRK